MSSSQVMSRKRLLIGDYFRNVGIADSTFHVTEEYHNFSVGFLETQHHENRPYISKKGPRLLKVHCTGGAWSAWMNVETGKLFHDIACEKPCGIPFDELVEVSVP